MCEDGGLKEFITWKLGTLISIVRQVMYLFLLMQIIVSFFVNAWHILLKLLIFSTSGNIYKTYFPLSLSCGLPHSVCLHQIGPYRAHRVHR
jgi:hypothetical protein